MIQKHSEHKCDKIVEDLKTQIKTANSTVRNKLKKIQQDLLEDEDNKVYGDDSTFSL